MVRGGVVGIDCGLVRRLVGRGWRDGRAGRGVAMECKEGGETAEGRGRIKGP